MITRPVSESRPLLADRGCRISAGRRLATLAEVVDHLDARGGEAILDATEIRVRRPAVGRVNRGRFISGKNKQNAIKGLVLAIVDGTLVPTWDW